MKRSSELRGRDRDDARRSIPRVAGTLLDVAKSWVGSFFSPFVLLLDSAFDGGFARIKKNAVRKSAINAFLNGWVGLCLNLVLLGKKIAHSCILQCWSFVVAFFGSSEQ